MKSALVPGIQLLNRLRYPYKFLLISLVFFIPMLIMASQLIAKVDKEISFMEQERLGVAYIKRIRAPIEHIQQHRGMSAGYLNGASEFRERMLGKQDVIDQLFTELRGIDEHSGTALQSGDRVAKLTQQWQRLKGEVFDLKPVQSFERHSALVAGLMEHISYIADTSNLILDPELDRFYMMDLMVSQLPKLTEAMGQARAIAATAAAQGAFTPQSWAQLAIREDRARHAKDAMGYDIGVVLKENPSLGPQLAAKAEAAKTNVANYAALLRKMLDADTVTITATEIFAESTRAIDAVFAFYDAVMPTLDAVLTERSDTQQGIKTLTLSILLGVFLIIVYLFTAFYFSVQDSINDLGVAIKRLADGDLTTRVEARTRDEIHHIVNGLNTMSSRFHELVGKVLASTDQVASAAEELSVVTDQTNEVLNQQRSQTEQVATAMNQMSATVQEVARNAAATSEATQNANEQSSNGHTVVDETVSCINQLAEAVSESAQVIQRLEKDSEDIGSVLDVIRGIAEQTNLLALNAAIEAARAGEQGRGFAVVADEVRTLASRTQDSTQEIQSMIERLQEGAQQAMKAMTHSTSQTEEGVSAAARAGEALAAIKQAVAIITDMSTQIASSAEEQSSVAEEINHNITQIAQMGDQNSAASNQTSASSTELARLASELRGMVAVFQV